MRDTVCYMSIEGFWDVWWCYRVLGVQQYVPVHGCWFQMFYCRQFRACRHAGRGK